MIMNYRGISFNWTPKIPLKRVHKKGVVLSKELIHKSTLRISISKNNLFVISKSENIKCFVLLIRKNGPRMRGCWFDYRSSDFITPGSAKEKFEDDTLRLLSNSRRTCSFIESHSSNNFKTFTSSRIIPKEKELNATWVGAKSHWKKISNVRNTVWRPLKKSNFCLQL